MSAKIKEQLQSKNHVQGIKRRMKRDRAWMKGKDKLLKFLQNPEVGISIVKLGRKDVYKRQGIY